MRQNLGPNGRNIEGRERGKSEEHAYSYSTIDIGALRRFIGHCARLSEHKEGEFLPHTDTNVITKTSREQQPEAAWRIAVRAAQEKQATNIIVLDLTGITSFTDYFVICSGANTRQNQAITDEIGVKLKKRGELPSSVEGYEQGDWILSDYGDFLVHVFSAKAREYYSLERLWREAKNVPVPAE